VIVWRRCSSPGYGLRSARHQLVTFRGRSVAVTGRQQRWTLQNDFTAVTLDYGDTRSLRDGHAQWTRHFFSACYRRYITNRVEPCTVIHHIKHLSRYGSLAGWCLTGKFNADIIIADRVVSITIFFLEILISQKYTVNFINSCKIYSRRRGS